MHLDGCVEGEAAYYGAPPGWIGRALKVQSTRCTFVCSIPTATTAARARPAKARPVSWGFIRMLPATDTVFCLAMAFTRRSTTPKPPSLRQQGLTLAASSWGSMLTPRAPCTDLCGRRKR